MCLGGERRDRPHSGQSLRGERTGSCPGGLPRDGQLHIYCIRGEGPSTQLQPPTGGASKRMGQNPGTSRCAVILSTNQLATFLWKMNEFLVVLHFILPTLTAKCCQ